MVTKIVKRGTRKQRGAVSPCLPPMPTAAARLLALPTNERYAAVLRECTHESSNGARWRYVFADGSVLIAKRTGPAAWAWEIEAQEAR